MINPLVSIIIPLFNRFNYTNRAITSVINQSYTSWELILVDDCSREEFILDDKFKDYVNIIVLRNELNIGSGLSRQRGLNIARGEYVSFLDSDDYYHKDFLMKIVESIKVNDEAIGIYCFSEFTLDSSVKSEYRSSQILPTLFDLKRPWTTCSWIWKKSKITNWKNLRTNQDSLFEFDNALICNRIAVLPEVLCYIDKDTKENTIDLVGNYTGEKNRDFVANYAFDNIGKFHKDKNYKNIKSSIVNRLIFVTAKLAGIGEKDIVRQNGIKLLKSRYFSGLLIVLISYFVNINFEINSYCITKIHISRL